MFDKAIMILITNKNFRMDTIMGKPGHLKNKSWIVFLSKQAEEVMKCRTAIFLLLWSFQAFPSPPDATYIPARDYFSTLTIEINKARASIVAHSSKLASGLASD
jgi:hypothetical protein